MIKEELTTYTIKCEDVEVDDQSPPEKRQKMVKDKCDLFSWFGYPEHVSTDKLNYPLLHKRTLKFQSHYHPDKPTGDDQMCLILNMVRRIAKR